MPRRNRRRESAYYRTLRMKPSKSYKSAVPTEPPTELDTALDMAQNKIQHLAQRIAYDNKPSLDRHKAHTTTRVERRAMGDAKEAARGAVRRMNAMDDLPPEAWKAYVTPHRMEIWYANLGNHGDLCIQNGIRPVLIFSNDINNEKAPIITVIPMSSNTSRLYLHSHVLVESDQVELADGQRFFHDGVLYLEQITTIDKTQLMNHVGRISDAAEMERINAAVVEHLMIGTAATAPAEPTMPSAPSAPSIESNNN